MRVNNGHIHVYLTITVGQMFYMKINILYLWFVVVSAFPIK